MSPNFDQAFTTARGFVAAPPGHFIDGAFVASAGGGWIPVIDPATGEALCDTPLASEFEVDRAVRAAHRAFNDPAWAKLKPAQRALLLLRLADAVEAVADEIAAIETLDNGMAIGFSRFFNVATGIDCLRYYAGWATKLNGETPELSMPGEWHAYTLRRPVGVAALIVPWNVPFGITIAKIAPAIAAGCTVVLKPAEQTPLTALRLAQLVQAVGFPPGVINVVVGTGVGAGRALVSHPLVDKISFTGSTAVGKQILAGAAHDLKRVSLELGGKSPVFVFPDADLGRACEAVMLGIFTNSGQVCAAGSRLFVHRDIYEDVLARLGAMTKSLAVGPGANPANHIGPLISPAQKQRVLGYIESGKQQGARVVVGGDCPDRPGFFVNPTIFADTRPDMNIMAEEIFGPVLCATSFGDENLEQLARRANETPYGLAGAIWTKDIGRVHRLARLIKSGTIVVNAPGALDPALPFGGFKQSGIGREQGREGIDAFTETTSIAISLDA